MHHTVPSIPARPWGSWHPWRCAEAASYWGNWERFLDPALKTAQGPVHHKSQPVVLVWGWGSSMVLPRAAKGKPSRCFFWVNKERKGHHGHASAGTEPGRVAWVWAGGSLGAAATEPLLCPLRGATLGRRWTGGRGCAEPPGTPPLCSHCPPR